MPRSAPVPSAMLRSPLSVLVFPSFLLLCSLLFFFHVFQSFPLYLCLDTRFFQGCLFFFGERWWCRFSRSRCEASVMTGQWVTLIPSQRQTNRASDRASSSACLIFLISYKRCSSPVRLSLLYQWMSLFFCHRPTGACERDENYTLMAKPEQRHTLIECPK